MSSDWPIAHSWGAVATGAPAPVAQTVREQHPRGNSIISAKLYICETNQMTCLTVCPVLAKKSIRTEILSNFAALFKCLDEKIRSFCAIQTLNKLLLD